MKILIIDNGTSFLDNLISLFKGAEITVVDFEHISVANANKFDLIVLSGGHKYSVVNHEKKYHNELEIVRKTKKPILGVCLGFELIAFTYGCELKRLRKKEKGIISINLLPDKITIGLKSIKVYESHRWAIKNLGDQLISLGNSQDGIELIRHKNRLIYGFQFHPEIIKNGTEGKKLFSNFLSIITK